MAPPGGARAAPGGGGAGGVGIVGVRIAGVGIERVRVERVRIERSDCGGPSERSGPLRQCGGRRMVRHG